MTAVPIERDPILRKAAELGASDLILTAGHPVMITLAGRLLPMEGTAVLTPSDSRRLVESFLTPTLLERFQRDLELDMRLSLADVAHFRVNVFVQRGHWGAAVRIVPFKAPLPSEIGLAPHVVDQLLKFTRGLVLVTGPTGSGKSTTVASVLEQMNQRGPARHIVTIEDPIEFHFQSQHAVFEQREVGSDTRSYARGLRGALRQMPHVIFVGEMLDLTSMSIALTAAETGNLVISTMVAQSAAQTVTRIIDSFPAHQQPQIRAQLSMTLRAVVSQVLLPRPDAKGRVAAREVMFVNPAIQNLIREDKIHQIANVLTTSAREDMLRLDDALADLVDKGQVSFDTAFPYFEDSEKRSMLQKRHFRVTPIREVSGR